MATATPMLDVILKKNMAFIRDITLRFSNRNIIIEIDPLLLPFVKSADKISTTRIITFNLYKLIYHIGAIQSRRYAPSNRLKYLDKTDLVEKIYGNTNEFRIKINETRRINGSETIKSISEDFGVGISVVIAESLFNIKSSTIQKIYGNGKRPDWKCQLTNNQILVVESKGSISLATSMIQQVNALVQKTKVTGDIQVASMTVLKENSVSTNRFLDPPIENGNNSPIMENHILRAGHYASVFGFLGNSKLSKYYSQMRKRLEGMISPNEQSLKNQTFNSIRTNDPSVNYQNINFVGSFYNIDENKYLFVGVDRRLLSYEGFISFVDYENDSDTNVDNDHYILNKDGVLIIEINEIQNFNNIVDIEQIKNYQDKITISDIDDMNEISFTKFFIHLLEKTSFYNILEQSLDNNLRTDLQATLNDAKYYFEFKILNNKRNKTDFFRQLKYYSKYLENEKLVFITNVNMENTIFENSNIVVIDRNKLEQIIKDNRRILEFINTTPNTRL